MNAQDSPAPSASTLVALFQTSDAAHHALEELHHGGFRQTWLAIMRPPDSAYRLADAGPPVAASDNAVARFFGFGEESLYEALVRHGVEKSEAARIDGTLPIDSAVVTVRGVGKPEIAAGIVTKAGGEIIVSSGMSGDDDTGANVADLGRDRTDAIVFVERRPARGVYAGGSSGR